MEHSFESAPASNEDNGEALEAYYGILKELGFFAIAPAGEAISGEQVMEFVETLTLEQEERIQELGRAYYRNQS